MSRAVTAWPPLTRPLAMALLLLGLSGAAVVALELALVLASGAEPSWLVALFPLVGGLHVAAGLVAWRRRPSNGVGAVLVLLGWTWLLAGLANTGVDVLIAVGLVTATLPLAGLVHLVHVFPSGHLRGWVSRVTVVGGYVVAGVLQAPAYLFSSEPHPFGVLSMTPRPDLVALGGLVQSAAGAIVMLVTSVVLVRRLALAHAERRRVLAPLLAYGVIAVLVIPVSTNVLGPALGLDPLTTTALQLVVLAGVPVAFATSMVRGGFARMGDVDELMSWLVTDHGERPTLARALAGALGDESVRLAFWVADGGTYVDGDGAAVDVPGGAGRGSVEVLVAGRRVGAIDYDEGLIADPAPVAAAGRLLAYAVDHERLTAELRASQDALRASLVRVVGAGDAERRRIARDLHDGLQVQLVLLALKARVIAATAVGSAGRESLGGATEELGGGIDQAAADLRRFVHGVMPALLIERGLCLATKELVEEMPIPTHLDLDGLGDAGGPDGDLSSVVQYTSYLIISEALANAVKHSRAGALRVRLGRTADLLVIDVEDDGVGGARAGGGAGLLGLTDRVSALGGRLHLDSPVGRGTRLHVEVPCGS